MKAVARKKQGNIPLPLLRVDNYAGGMSSPFSELASALRERLMVIADRELYQRDPTLHLEKLKTVSEQIGLLAKSLPLPLNKQLAHFLENCSYDKALAWIENHSV